MAFTVIIPTLWLSGDLPATLALLDSCSEIDEIILIDNNPGHRQPLNPSEKLCVISCPKNIYVNPAWNRGARLAKSSILCFLNDDVQPRKEVFNFVEKVFNHNLGCQIGMVGLDWLSPYSELQVTPVGWRKTNWFGSMWFIRSCDYSPIPLAKIWGGEDWNMIKRLNRKKVSYELSGFSEAGKLFSGSTSISALGGVKGAIGWVLKFDKYLWNLVLRPLLYVDKIIVSLSSLSRSK